MNMNIEQYAGQYHYADRNAAYKARQTQERTAAGAWDNLKDTYESTVGKTKEKPEVQLSEKAKKLLKELQAKYGNMDFFVADYASAEEAQGYLNRGRKEYSVLLDPETLEEMANDKDTLKKYDDILSNMGNTFQKFQESLGEDADRVRSFGVAIDNNGEISYFAELEKSSAKQRERIEAAREKKQEDRKAQAAKEKRIKEQPGEGETKRFHAAAIEELVEKIKNDAKNQKAWEQGVYPSFDMRF